MVFRVRIAALVLLASACAHRGAPPPAERPPEERVRETHEGRASWYGAAFQGHRTANGERFDDRQLTAAHRTLPFGTRVRVTHLGNGRSVVVRINDRGPYVAGRLIDLSEAAARALHMLSAGAVRVRIEILDDAP